MFKLFILLLITPIITAFNKEFYIAFKHNNVSLLENKLNDISNPENTNYGKYLSIDEINNITKLDNNKYYIINNWLNINDITILNNYSDAYKCSSSIDNINKLFNTSFDYTTTHNEIKYKNFEKYHIPQELNDIVLFIEGLTNNNISKRETKYSQNYGNVDPGYCGKEVIDRIYNITNLQNMSNSSICSVEYQSNPGYSNDDLLSAENLNGLSNNTVNYIVGNNEGTDTESQLDIQMMGINLPDTSLWFWDTENWLYSLAIDMVNAKKIPDIVSMSWGWAEDSQCTIINCNETDSREYINRVNTEYIKLGLRGVTITAASGDAGAPGRTNEDCDIERNTTAIFPGSSPYVTSVAATYIKNDKICLVGDNITWKTPLCINNTCATGTQEYVTNFNDTGWTSGGGISSYSNKSSWQILAIQSYLQSNVSFPKNMNINGRFYPDVSAIGHNCPVIDGGFLTGVDGTSCSSPVFASIIAMLNQHQIANNKSKLGFVNPILYKMYQSDSTIFNDINKGNNWCTEMMCCDEKPNGGSDFGYMAAKGYDPVYGLGTPNVGKMKEWLDRNTF
uniref:Peptidase S53 domain-containing protein n=1 Tax=viral metagenome TaxID=1070528 RepID=A0A6C0IXU0_9ZZZZ